MDIKTIHALGKENSGTGIVILVPGSSQYPAILNAGSPKVLLTPRRAHNGHGGTVMLGLSTYPIDGEYIRIFRGLSACLILRRHDAQNASAPAREGQGVRMS